MHSPGNGIRQTLMSQGHGKLGPLFVKRTNHRLRKSTYLAGFNHGTRHRLSDIVVRQPDDRRHRTHVIDHILPGHNDSGSRSGKPQFGQTHCQDNIFIPDRGDVGKNYTGKWLAIGIVNNQWNPLLCCQFAKLCNFVIGQDIATRVRRTGNCNRSVLLAIRIQIFKIDPVFELPFTNPLDKGFPTVEEFDIRDALIAIANVFRDNRQKNLPLSASGHFPGKPIQEKEKCCLPTIRDRYILTGQVPSILPFQKIREHLTESRAPCRLIIVSEDAVKLVGCVLHQLQHPLAKDLLHLRDVAGIPSSHHAEFSATESEGFAQIIHEFAGPGMTCKLVGKNRFWIGLIRFHTDYLHNMQGSAKISRPYAIVLNPPITLTIAGSDSSAGAGIQADLKTFSALGAYGVNAVTAVVAEVPGEVSQIQAVDPGLLDQQLNTLESKYPLGAAKTGMLATAENVEVVADFFRRNPEIHLVVDPVFHATAGAALLDNAGIELVKEKLLPSATLITPNIAEAESLLAHKIDSRDSFESAPRELAEKYGCEVLVKGGRFFDDDTIRDAAWLDGQLILFSRKRLEVPDIHGTGCTLSAAIAASLAFGEPLENAIRIGRDYLYEAIRQYFQWGKSDRDAALNHFPNGIRVPES